MVQVEVAVTPAQLDSVRSLLRAFIDWHRIRHADHLDLIDAYFDASAYDDELRSLPGIYSPPSGRLLLASVNGSPAGCVAMRPITDDCCEMKRMFVYPQFHGQGVGEALGGAIVESGRAAGYRAMRLDTGVLQAEAIGLYEKVGFKRVDPYYQAPAAMNGFLVFMELGFR